METPSRAEERGQPQRLYVNALLRRPTCRHHRPRQVGMQPTRAIRDTGEVPAMERRRLQEAENAVIHRRTRQLHQVIDERLAAKAIRMEEAARFGCGSSCEQARSDGNSPGQELRSRVLPANLSVGIGDTFWLRELNMFSGTPKPVGKFGDCGRLCWIDSNC